MALYRLFILDLDGAVTGGVELRFNLDEEAMEWADFMLEANHIGEVWCGPRYVGGIRKSATHVAETLEPYRCVA